MFASILQPIKWWPRRKPRARRIPNSYKAEQLVGRKIVGVHREIYGTAVGPTGRVVALVLDDESMVYALADVRGDAAGELCREKIPTYEGAGPSLII